MCTVDHEFSLGWDEKISTIYDWSFVLDSESRGNALTAVFQINAMRPNTYDSPYNRKYRSK